MKTFLLALCVFLGPSVHAQLTADQIAQKHVDAIGGIEAIDSLHSLVYRGAYHEPGPMPADKPLIPHTYQAFMRPYYEAIGDPAEKYHDVREGFDGSSWEYYGDPGIVLRTVGAAASASRHAVEFLQDALVDYKEKGTTLELRGTEKIAAKDAYKLFAKYLDGSERLVFVDMQTFLIIADRKTAPIHAFGQAVTSESRYSDFRPVNGVLFHFSELEVEIATGRVLSEMRKISIEANTITDASAFTPAPFTRTPLQQFLELLYMERTDHVCVMNTYRLFRRAHPEMDTRDGVEFIGYQMVKMSDYKGAIELLRANAADYPKSASSQFGLGRAYKAAGETALAKEAFEHALQINPNYKRASDGLNGLR